MEATVGLALRTALLLLIYPVLYIGVLGLWNRPQRFATWGTASFVGLVVFVIVFVQAPATFDVLDLGPRIARPLAAYVAGLVTTAAIVLITRPKR